jgi:hypothetical protein
MDGGGYRCELLTVESTRTPSPNISSDRVSATSALGLPGAIAASSPVLASEPFGISGSQCLPLECFLRFDGR